MNQIAYALINVSKNLRSYLRPSQTFMIGLYTKTYKE